MMNWMTKLPSWVRMLGAAALLHAVFTYPFPWEPPSGRTQWQRISPDFSLIAAFLAATTIAWGDRWWARHCAVFLTIVVPVLRFGMTVIPANFGKPFDLYNDILLIPGLVHLLTHQWSTGRVLVVAAIALLVLSILWWILHRAWSSLLGGSRASLKSIVAAITIQLLVLGQAALDRVEPRVALFSRGQIPELASEVGEILRSGLWRYRELWAERVKSTLHEVAPLPGTVGKLQDVDVYLLFIESYGRIALEHATARPIVENRLRIEQDRLKAHGFEMLSTVARPSIVGGMSGLAHAELLSGIPVENRRVFDLLIQSLLRPLPKTFQATGHSTWSVHPAMPIAWPDGARFYGFDHDYFRDRLPYRGTEYPWGYQPDQSALTQLLPEIRKPNREPLFLLFASVTSHAPFAAIPPYFEDWNLAQVPRTFDAPPDKVFSIDWASYASHPDVPLAYAHAIDYALRSGFGFATELSQPSLIIILGDHQPPGFLPATLTSEGQRNVPLHVLSNRHELLLPFLARGLEPGLVPANLDGGLPFHRFLTQFLQDFGGPVR